MVQQPADALALLAETALHHGIDPGTPGERYQVVVHVDAEILADGDASGQSVLEDGARVPAGTSQRLACDASRVVMRHDPGDAVQVPRGRHDAEGLRVNAHTATPGWLGERLDVGWAIDVLHPLAQEKPGPERRTA